MTYVKCKPKGNCHGNCAFVKKMRTLYPYYHMSIQMNRNVAYDEVNKMAPPKKEEMEACPAYGLVL